MVGETIVRVQFEMPQERVDEIDRLAKAIRMRTRRELFESAITLFEWAVSEVMLGRVIATVDEAKGRYQPMLMPAFVAARRGPKSKSPVVKGVGRLTHALAKVPR